MTPTPSYLEDRISQIPALRLLMALGWQYLSPAEADALRGGRAASVLLESILIPWLRAQPIQTGRGGGDTPTTMPLPETAVAEAVRRLKQPVANISRGLLPESASAYELLTLGTSVPVLVDGDRKSPTVRYIDWQHPDRNVYHVTDEFTVTRRGTSGARRPDIVLFVNGIPLAVIECKRPDIQTSSGQKAVWQGVSQMLRNQALKDEIPHLFVYAQLLLAASVNDALYGTTATPEKFWAVWQEEGERAAEDAALMPLINQPLTADEKARLYGWRPEVGGNDGVRLRAYFDGLETQGARLPTEQDRTIAALLRPARLLDLTYGFTLYDNGLKKVARYQQYHAIKATVTRVQHLEGGRRAGGVIWHTTGSGKSLTMVMLAKALAMHPAIPQPRVLIVTDRIDLDEQISRTFRATGKQVYKADSGRDLIRLIREPRHEIITTVIGKFEAAAQEKMRETSADVFVLVDESHRSQYGISQAKMREVFPNACYIGFTGTPLMKKEKTTAEKFGGFIHKYTMRQAVEDGAVVPLLYEGRIVDLDVHREALDSWFERRTRDLTDEQRADLKRKMSRAEEVHGTGARRMAIAYDLAEHYKAHWKGKGLKGQFAVSSKALAVDYRAALQDEGINCEVIISAPDTREGSEDDGNPTGVNASVQAFWKRMMQVHGDEASYVQNVKGQFADPDGLDMLIVVDKLLVGFDEPRNTVLYVDKPLREHALLQAIARVNRLFPGKDYGYIVDYRGVLGDLNEALDTYNALEEFDAEDVAGTVTDIREVIEALPGLHSNVWAVFGGVKREAEAMERHLEPEDVRQRFYDALNAYAKALKAALASVEFYERTPDKQAAEYKNDLRFFHALRGSVRMRYAETVDYSEYEARIRTLLDDNISASGVNLLTAEVNIFDEDAFAQAVAQMTSAAPAARADAIANQMKRTTTTRMDEDPAFYRRFSNLVEATIEAYRQGRIGELEYLNTMEAALGELRAGSAAALPGELAGRADAAAYFGLLSEAWGEGKQDGEPNAGGQTALATPLATPLATLALELDDMIARLKVRDWQHSPDTMNRMKTALEDGLYNFGRDHARRLPGETLDALVEQIVETARRREAAGVSARVSAGVSARVSAGVSAGVSGIVPA